MCFIQQKLTAVFGNYELVFAVLNTVKQSEIMDIANNKLSILRLRSSYQSTHFLVFRDVLQVMNALQEGRFHCQTEGSRRKGRGARSREGSGARNFVWQMCQED